MTSSAPVRLRPSALASLAALFVLLAGLAGAATTVRLSTIDPLVPSLARGLGYLAEEGIDLQIVAVESVSKEDYLMQEPLVAGRLDASQHWLHHVIFGARHALPLKAVLMIQDSPGMKIMVANRVKDQIHSAADFRGRNVAEGAGYATKSLLTSFLARQAGLPRDSYTPVLKEVEGRREAVLKGLRENQVDVLSFMEPMTSAIEATGQVTTLYDLTNRTGTIKALGDVWPAHTLFLSARYIQEHPDIVQHLVNAYVRTIWYLHTHSAQEIVDRLPADYFAKRERAAEVDRVRKQLTNYAFDGRIPESAVRQMIDAVKWSHFDSSEEGVFRATGDAPFSATDLFDNRFVEQAQRELR